ncbi:hypothetical protein WME99_50695 [Sorangium sp. So ce136]
MVAEDAGGLLRCAAIDRGRRHEASPHLAPPSSLAPPPPRRR